MPYQKNYMSRQKKFYLEARKPSGIYYYIVRDAVSRKTTAYKSTGTTDKKQAEAVGMEWANICARVAVLIAYHTGMRIGEIRALRICDIHPDRINVRHSWGRISKRKSTKNQEICDIPIMPELYNELLAYIKQMNILKLDNLLLPAKNPENPYDYSKIVKEFNKMLEKIGIDEKIRKERNIVFHSWRHLLAKNLVEKGANKAIGMKIMGQKTSQIFDHYADHVDKETFRQMAKAIENVSQKETPKEPIPPLWRLCKKLL